MSLSALVPIRAFIHVDFSLSLSLSLSLSDAVRDTKSFRCQCQSGWRGNACHIKVKEDLCKEVYCSNGGTCEDGMTCAVRENNKRARATFLLILYTHTHTNKHTHTHTHTRARLHTQIRARTHSGRCACPKEWSGYRCRLSTAYNSTRNEVCSPSPGNITSYDCWYDCSSRPRQENYECIVLKKTGPTSFTRGGSKSG